MRSWLLLMVFLLPTACGLTDDVSAPPYEPLDAQVEVVPIYETIVPSLTEEEIDQLAALAATGEEVPARFRSTTVLPAWVNAEYSDSTDFVMVADRSGAHEFHLWVGEGEFASNGFFWIRASQLQTGEAISMERLLEATRVDYQPDQGPIGYVPPETGFIVPVGSIGQAEEVQFDLIFSAPNSESFTVMSKNYQIQGWTR